MKDLENIITSVLKVKSSWFKFLTYKIYESNMVKKIKFSQKTLSLRLKWSI